MEGQFVKGNETKRPTQRTNEYTAVVSGGGGDKSAEIRVSFSSSFLPAASLCSPLNYTTTLGLSDE